MRGEKVLFLGRGSQIDCDIHTSKSPSIVNTEESISIVHCHNQLSHWLSSMTVIYTVVAIGLTSIMEKMLRNREHS